MSIIIYRRLKLYKANLIANNFENKLYEHINNIELDNNKILINYFNIIINNI